MDDADARNEVTQMSELIDLTSDDFPECESCNGPTKRAVGKSFDLDGPGQVGTFYNCENKSCRALRRAKIQAWNVKPPELKEMARLARKYYEEHIAKSGKEYADE